MLAPHVATAPLIVAQVLGQSAHLWDGSSFREVGLSGRLKAAHAGSRVTTLAVGDRVEIEEAPPGPPRIVAVAPRETQLERSAGTNGPHALTKVIAANASQAVIVASMREPPFRPGLVDRWSLLARRGGMTPLLALNKADLGTEEEALRAVAEACIPIAAIRVSAATGFGIEDLRRRLIDHI